ncbi:MAG: hypothetical protein HDT38_07200 [Clostridiales bacterium]|nr:hypothetical protein [Clostridiales bacterium]
MRSGTSYFDWTVFKKTVCRFWPLWGAYSALWLIVLPLEGLMLLRLEANAHPGVTGGYMENFAYYDVPGRAQAALSITVVFGVLCAMAVFSHLYNARSANLFGSLPIRREGLFLTHYLAGLAFLLVPNGVVFLLTLAVEAAGGCVVMSGLLFWLAVCCGECFFFYSLAVFCAMFTGHILALPAFYGIANVLAYGVAGLVLTVFQMFYYGFDTFSDGVFEVIKWLTPVERLEESVISTREMVATVDPATGETVYRSAGALIFSGLPVVGIYALAAVVLAACAFLLYRARNLESAGDVVSVKVMRPVFKYGVAFCAGLALGMGTAFAVGGLEEFGLAVAIIIWGVIGYFAAQMLLDKSFKVFRKWKGAAVVAGAFLLLSLVVGLDLTGFETRMPDPANVASVYVYGLDAVRLGDSGDLVRLELDDPGQIELITALHRAAVEQRDWEGTSTEYRATPSLELTYTMKDGSTLIRRYRYIVVDPNQTREAGTAAWALEQLYGDRDLYWRAYEFDELEGRIAQPGWRLERAELSGSAYNEKYGYQNLGTSYFYAPYARTLLDAVEEDFKAGRIGVRTLADAGRYPPAEGKVLAFWAQDSDYNNFWMEIAVQDNSSSTLKALEELAEYAVEDAAGGYRD